MLPPDHCPLRSATAGTPPQLMAVPTHFYKVVLGEFKRREGGQQAALGAFAMPNAPIEPDVPLSAFAVPLSALEEVAGRRRWGQVGQVGRWDPAKMLGPQLDLRHDNSCLCLTFESAGLRFFPSYLSDQRRAALDDAALAVQRIGYAALQKLKPGPSPPLLLPAPKQAAEGGGGDGSVGSGGAAKLQLPVTDQRLSLGAIHVCEHTECRLPSERFWEACKGSAGGSGSKGGSNV